MERTWLLIVCILLCFIPGTIGGLATATGEGSWYAGLTRPSFAPPNWLFGPVWTALYLGMGVSLYLALRAGAGTTEKIVFGIQLVLNTLWTFLFFGLQVPWIALGEIVVLWCMILWTILLFWQRTRWGATLLMPYLAWVTFATALNYGFALLN